MFRADGSVGNQKTENTFIHTRNIYLVDKKLKIRGVYDTGKPESMDLLAKDIETLKKTE
jgi:cytochrome oxidase Cu insertion factor (SCO1/SenC/PrrC family)